MVDFAAWGVTKKMRDALIALKCCFELLQNIGNFCYAGGQLSETQKNM